MFLEVCICYLETAGESGDSAFAPKPLQLCLCWVSVQMTKSFFYFFSSGLHQRLLSNLLVLRVNDAGATTSIMRSYSSIESPMCE